MSSQNDTSQISGHKRDRAAGSDKLQEMLDQLAEIVAMDAEDGKTLGYTKKHTPGLVANLSDEFFAAHVPFFVIYTFRLRDDPDQTHNHYFIKDPAKLKTVLMHVQEMRRDRRCGIEVWVTFLPTIESAKYAFHSAHPECVVKFDDAEFVCKSLTKEFDGMRVGNTDAYLEFLVSEIGKTQGCAHDVKQLETIIDAAGKKL